ncbi:MAG: hypothetical protein Q7S41_03795 [Candidatus Limnocylindria bacterium]|nr:hypothetical protein [Candidatus Limnocylindria bacterium]
MEPGLYATFLDRNEPPERELPPVGPLDAVVLRQKTLVAERRSVQQAEELGVSIDRWLEAELELQRATGEEPGGTKRSDLRVTARDGVFLRFAVFGEARERDTVPELGPFAVVHIGPRGVEADGQLLATRGASDLATWELTTAAGDDFAGLHKADIAFRTPGTVYHPSITPAKARPRVTQTASQPSSAPPPVAAPPPRSEPAFTPPPRIEPAFTPPPAAPPPSAPDREPLFREEPRQPQPAYSPPRRFDPPAEEPSALTARDLELIKRIERERSEETMRARIQEDERRRLGVDEADDSATTWAMRYRPQSSDVEAEAESGGAGPSWGAALWRLRFAIIGVLLFAVGVYGLTVVRNGGSASVPGQVQIQTVGIAQKFSSSRWEFIANGTQKVPTAGAARARGIYYVVRLGVTNRGTEGAQLSPSEFVLIDANGVEHVAESLSSDAYYGSVNTQSPYIWPQSFAVGKNVTVPVVFDVDPSLPRGMLLKVADLPGTRVKLD